MYILVIYFDVISFSIIVYVTYIITEKQTTANRYLGSVYVALEER